MNGKLRHRGSVLLLAIFLIALLSAVVMGMLQVNTEEILLMQNQINAAKALAVAEAGLNDAFAQIRADDTWAVGYTDKPFDGGSYTVAVTGSLPNLTITSTGTSSQDFVSHMAADVTVGSTAPYIIRIDNLRINE
jgi:Tfp pilus assembly protein PilX